MQDLFFFSDVVMLGFMSNAIKLLLTELVGQCRNILPFDFSALTEKAVGNIFLH